MMYIKKVDFDLNLYFLLVIKDGCFICKKRIRKRYNHSIHVAKTWEEWPLYV